MWFFMFSPTINDWQKAILIAQNELLNPKEAMEAILDKVREDVDMQFDENQGRWTPLHPYTIERKTKLKADMRILHETRQGQGLRLRDAYKQTGYVTNNGVLVYTYPPEKPYAKDHQMGVGSQTRTTARRERGPNGRERSDRDRELKRLDALFDRLFDD